MSTNAAQPGTMKAIEISQPGAPEVLVVTERPMPVPQAGELLVKIAAAGVNRPDVLQRQELCATARRFGYPRPGNRRRSRRHR